MIKATAIKCRHCGEFLDEEEGAPAARPAAAAPPGGTAKWIIPLGAAGLARFLGIFALIPLPVILWVFLEGAGAREATKSAVMGLGGAVNGVFGLGALIAGVLGVFLARKAPTVGKYLSAFFGILAGLFGLIAYPLLVIYWTDFVKWFGQRV
jgi:hypothetical protein